jgi:predicted lipoprotein with Yx(FWY)xxD motif
MRLPQVLGLAAVGVIALAACGSGGGGNSAGSYGAPATSPPPAVAQSATGAVHTGQTKLGSVLVDANGRTLYGFTSDTNGMSNCDGSCATIWPPVTVSGPTLPTRYDAKVFSVVMRGDGTYQLRAGKWPLYRYTGDAAPGDSNGQGVGGFFVVQPTGALNKA